MDVSSTLRGGLIATSLPQHLPGTIIYPSKENAWQPMVTPLPLLPTTTAEIPKESIIANTDFTTTSVIAKRRLSSKKRRKQRESVDELELSPAQQSPVLTTPNEQDCGANKPYPYLSHPSSSSLSSSSIPVSSTTTTTPPSSSSIPAIPQHSLVTPHHIATMQQGSMVGSNPMISGATQYIALPQHNQVLSQIPPELAYQMLQQEGHTIIATSSGPMAAQFVETTKGQALSQSTAHYNTSPQLCNDQQHTNQMFDSHEAVVASSASSLTVNAQTLEQQLHHHHQQQLQHQLQQHQLHQLHLHHQHQQQLAMMQMYGVQGLVPGPVSIQDLHHQLQLQAQGGVPIVGHTHQTHPNQLMSVPIQTVYAAQSHSVPIATTLAPPELLLQVQNGSWVTPTAAPVFGSCIVNPIQPGLLATSLVK